MKIFTSKTQKIGEIGEKAAVKFLMKQGFSIVERNVSNKFGEIDIVAKKGKQYNFIEVKTDRGGSILASENLHGAKLTKFYKSVEYYCLTHQAVGDTYTVSAILVSLSKEGEPKIEFLEHL